MRIPVFVASFLLSVAAFGATPQTVTLYVQNMTCPLCKITVKKALEKTSGVMEAKVDYEKKTATVRFDPDKATPQALTEATRDAGFPSTVRK
jgi:mercuric ion binding protein